uniref:Uncharacterized protein n=1 Tax=Anopheles arabiensis TaxID=7173 RepID=A0A182IHG0_ANOAR
GKASYVGSHRLRGANHKPNPRGGVRGEAALPANPRRRLQLHPGHKRNAEDPGQPRRGGTVLIFWRNLQRRSVAILRE